MRNCPNCLTAMQTRRTQRADVDLCPRCAGIYLDPGEGEALGLDMAMLLGFNARALGGSERTCPDHAQAMQTFAVTTPGGELTVERAACCGGVFLDAGEAGQLRSSAPGAAATATPSVAAPSSPDPSATAASAAATKTCPDCARPLVQEQLHGFEVDVCHDCAHLFFDAGEAERAGIDTRAIFGDAPWGAVRTGESGTCPNGHGPLQRYEKTLLADNVPLAYAPCCGGVWLAQGDLERAKRVSRRCVSERADAQYASGQRVERTAAQLTPEEQRRAAIREQQSNMLMHLHVMQTIERAGDAVSDMHDTFRDALGRRRHRWDDY